MKPSGVISHVNVKLVPSVSASVFVSIITVWCDDCSYAIFIRKVGCQLPQPGACGDSGQSEIVSDVQSWAVWLHSVFHVPCRVRQLTGYFVYKCTARTQHLSHQFLMMETEAVSEILNTSLTLTQLISQEGFILYCWHESFKSYIIQFGQNKIGKNNSSVITLNQYVCCSSPWVITRFRHWTHRIKLLLP
jgi:hypothetical protein